ncbi:MAG: ATP-dependent RecD-like DNA helicase [Planctomycetes bacterium]|nr:ATP-dependent RecD-like DNA helicase [Planctomycetota bacterium]
MRQNGENPAQNERIESLEGTIERFTFRNEASGFAVVRFRPEGGHQTLAITGQLAQLTEGQQVTISGTRTEHPRFGPQIEVEAVEARVPSSVAGIRAYLSSSLVKGIGPAMAERITDAFGTDALRVIEEEPERLTGVPELGPKKSAELVDSVREQRNVQAVMVFLRTHGLGEGLAARIVKQLGRNASAMIQANPYRLADQVLGIGFKRADQLAERLGIDHDAPERVRAGIEHSLSQAARDGHCFLPRRELRERAAKLLGCEPQRIDEQLPALEASGRVIVETRFAADEDDVACYPSTLHQAEVGTAVMLAELASAPLSDLAIDAPSAIEWFANSSGMQLPDGQYRAVHAALTSQVSVITGGPGVGKTTIIRALVEVFRANRRKLVLAAPTGRAAKRLDESTGHGASTLHRLLDYQPGRGDFARDDGNPVEADMIVVDEASMIDVQLAYALLRATAAPTRLVLVGDIDQLPSVGPGNVLADVIASGRVPVTRLTEIFRQGGDSDIVRSAHRILAGEEPVGGSEGSDFYFVEARDSAHARALIKEIVTQRIPSAFGLDPMRDVQVLCPMYRGETGADALNADLQQALNPGGGGVSRGGHVLRAGDRVLQTRNDYDLDVFNGDAGRITHIDANTNRVVVEFGNRRVEYAPTELDNLVPSYAISVHRSQGSEYPAVVVPITTDHFLMLRRNLLYTAITRGKRLVIVVGQRKALRMAIDNDRETQRHSLLAERMKP